MQNIYTAYAWISTQCKLSHVKRDMSERFQLRIGKQHGLGGRVAPIIDPQQSHTPFHFHYRSIADK